MESHDIRGGPQRPDSDPAIERELCRQDAVAANHAACLLERRRERARVQSRERSAAARDTRVAWLKHLRLQQECAIGYHAHVSQSARQLGTPQGDRHAAQHSAAAARARVRLGTIAARLAELDAGS